MRMSLFAISSVLVATAACRSAERREGASTKAVEAAAAKPRPPDPIEAPATRVTSKDGTAIAFDKTGRGPALILVSGALSQREQLRGKPLVTKLSEHFTVYVYDRRGRGDSTDVQPYAVEREIEDLHAVVTHAGGAAYVFGVSSGAALALQGAAALGPTKITRLALYEPPYGQDSAAFAHQKQRVNELIKSGAPGDAAAFFLTAIGLPPVALDAMKRSGEWDLIKKIDFTLAYDFQVLGTGAVPETTARAIAVPALILDGEKTMPFMHPTCDRIAALIPNAQRQTLAGQTHQVNGDVTAPILTAFFTAAVSEK